MPPKADYSTECNISSVAQRGKIPELKEGKLLQDTTQKMVKIHLAVAGFHDWTRQPKRHGTNKHLER